MNTAAAPLAPPAQRATIAIIGNPNTGKSTLFNALTGLRQHVGNYPGVTVERRVGHLVVDGQRVDLIDLPGTYSLAAQSPDEIVAVDLLLGRRVGDTAISGVIAIIDASNLQRNLYLVSQLLELDQPLVVVLNMIDLAAKRGIKIDTTALSHQLGVPVVTTQANKGLGCETVKEAIGTLLRSEWTRPTAPPKLPAELTAAATTVANDLDIHPAEAARILIDIHGEAAARTLRERADYAPQLSQLRAQVSCRGPLSALEAAARYTWIREALVGVVTRPAQRPTQWTDTLDTVLTHKLWGTLTFTAVTLFVFQSIYSWAGPLMEMIDWLFGTAGNIVGGWLPEGALRSLIVDGIIAGVGGVLVFIPQILILFLFIAILEDCGYMARAAFLMDKLFARVGLSGKSFIPLLSSFACAIPGIMAARTIENRRDRLVTILVAPLMSCSARLPVYTIMIAAFIPPMALGGWLGIQGLTLFAMHALGLVVAIPIVWLFKKTILKGSTPPFVMELPTYKRPSVKLVGYRVYDRGKAFVRRAGTIIFAMTIIVWALAYFPRSSAITADYTAARTALISADPSGMTDTLAVLSREEAGAHLRNSFFGRVGHIIEPAVVPLGWDWRIGLAAIASFPAREVIIATLGTIYNLGDDVDAESTGLQSALRLATWPDGRLVYNIPVALSIMVFFALCCQCGATVATIRRETNSWGWAWFTFGYMTTLAYIAAFATYRIGMWIL